MQENCAKPLVEKNTVENNQAMQGDLKVNK